MVPKKGNGPLAAKISGCWGVLGSNVGSLRGKLAILPNCTEIPPFKTIKTLAVASVPGLMCIEMGFPKLGPAKVYFSPKP